MKKGEFAALAVQLQAIGLGDVIEISKRELAAIQGMIDAINAHVPSDVTEYVTYPMGFECRTRDYGICPACGESLDHTYQDYCDRCGQRLRWISKKKMTQKSWGRPLRPQGFQRGAKG